MPNVTVYSADYCPYCFMAKKLLEKKGVQWDEIDVSRDPGARDAMRQRAGGRNTVPQIFIGETHVGGCDDLYALDQRGNLEAMLNDAAA